MGIRVKLYYKDIHKFTGLILLPHINPGNKLSYVYATEPMTLKKHICLQCFTSPNL